MMQAVDSKQELVAQDVQVKRCAGMEASRMDELEQELLGSQYIVVKALENGVTISGMTRGRDTKFHHSEKLDAGEVVVAQFTEHTSAMKIRGRAEILTRYGRIESGVVD